MPDRRAAARQALASAPATGSPVERALLAALRLRYAGDDLGAADRAYAQAMRAAHAQYPADPDVAALFAEALLDLRPFAQWTPRGAPAPETPELVALLEAALARWPEHPGLNHFYIHTMESSPHPERALPSAERIGTMMPAAAHLVHMPSHIFLRTGRAADAAEANRKAIAADARWQQAGRGGPYYAMYPLHNHHFLWLSTLALGRAEEARAEATLLAAACTPEMLRMMAGMEPLLVVPSLTEVRFAEWTRVLALPAPWESPRDEWPFASGVWHFARARAYAALGKPDQARGELDELARLIASTPAARKMGANAAVEVLRVADGIARGDLLARTGHAAEGERLLREAVARQDALYYDEPPSWPLSAREPLGRVLLAGRRWAGAARVFEDALAKTPESGWALIGLRAATAGRGGDVAELDRRIERAFAKAERIPSADQL
jgi:hypothetical protein